MKKWFLRWVFFALFILSVFVWNSWKEYKENLNIKEEELLIFENNLDIQFTNQEEAKRIASLAKKYIYSHALEPIENIDVAAPYESIYVNPYAEWVAELNRILEQGDIDSWTQLFKQDVFQEWYSRQDVRNSPEAFLSSYLQKKYSNINRFDYYSWRDKHYIRINYKDGQSEEKVLPLIKRDNHLVIDMTIEEWENYIKRK
ncbi:hypothetical protein ACP3VS_18505 [Lysinibacillus sp. VIII_CA]|uniref:hypothetical protein n=1 Tax=Lysinibacillus sp. VIII_CA TaxID=3417452 RepID=UPI003CF72384